MKNYGIKVAQSGDDVLSVADKGLVFSSKYNTLKIFKKGEKTITTNGSGIGSGTVAHNLGYAPTFHVFRKGTASWQRNNAASIDSSTYTNSYFPNPGTPHNWINYHASSRISSNSTNLNFYIQGANNTSYTFTYFIFFDLAEEYTDNAPVGSSNYGIKIAQPDKDVFDQKDFQLGFSSRFRPLNFNNVKSNTITISLPAIAPSFVDQEPEEAVYAEITHGMGYPPLFFGMFKYSSGTVARETSYGSNSSSLDLGLGGLIETIDSWCDSTRIRFSFWRKAYYEASDSWTAQTLTIKYLIFNEDLSDV
jgi:hypothetical protein